MYLVQILFFFLKMSLAFINKEKFMIECFMKDIEHNMSLGLYNFFKLNLPMECKYDWWAVESRVNKVQSFTVFVPSFYK